MVTDKQTWNGRQILCGVQHLPLEDSGEIRDFTTVKSVSLRLVAASGLSIPALARFCSASVKHNLLLPPAKVVVPNPLTSVKIEHVSSARTHEIRSPWTCGRAVWEIARGPKGVVVRRKRLTLLIKGLNLAVPR